MNTAENNLQKELKKVSKKDREYIQSGLDMLGPDPSTLGHMKNIFFGNINQSLVFPYPSTDPEEVVRCDEMIERLDHYLRNEHPTIQIDQKQEIPPEVVKRLFEIGVLGMTIPIEYGGSGLGITSYNRVLSRIGRTCGSTAVMVSAHQSIGCKALMLFGTGPQKERFLPRMAKDALSAFCLSEPNVGCDAGGQETWCELSEDGTHYVINGEKKWATSGALAGFFTVMARQEILDPKTGKKKNKITALICTPDMDGIEIFSRNRSKCGIRGTWQARIRLTNVKVPVENRLHHEGRGLNVALSCLNYGRCTLSAGMVGAGSYAYEQALKWAEYRYQFKLPINDFEQTREKLARMGAYVYAMEAMLYMTTGFLDRGDEDIMVETAICKVTCSELGWLVLEDCVQIMGGESYMTENEIERIWRDSRINRIVEGANEVMHQFICNYGGKNLLESLLAIKNAPLQHIGPGMRIAAEIFLGIKRAAPKIDAVDPSLKPLAHRLSILIRDFSHDFKRIAAELKEGFATDHLAHSRVSRSVICIHGLICVLSRLDKETRDGIPEADLQRNRLLVEHLFDLYEHEIEELRREIRDNTDDSMRRAAASVMEWGRTLPNSDYAIPEKTPVESARGSGKKIDMSQIEQFGEGTIFNGRDC
jgi:alkylation response protein AidB-like acyl-CoA dehydrogenase